MNLQRAPAASLRPERLDTTRLVRALVFSALLHLLCWGTYSVGKRYHIWERFEWPAWVKRLTAPPVKKPDPNVPLVTPETEPPLMFVNVSPQAITPEPPKDATYYSSQNSKAANPNPDRDTNIPKITGKQDVVPETENAERHPYDKLQPNPTPAPEQSEQREKSRTVQETGDLNLGKPEKNPGKENGDFEKPRPRRLAEVAQNQLPSRKMRQDGGVKRRVDSTLESLDVKSSKLGAYDELFINAVRARWFDLLDERGATAEESGRVVLEFKLQHDGRITDMKEVESTVSATRTLICQKAISDPAPYEKWSTEMRLLIGSDFRTLKFTFIYY